ncbi:MAG: glutamate 5-kinase [Kiritimatiellaeota bacterium]|nr:glutamate 5-kinase [Kiritimatiellota bacterium]
MINSGMKFRQTLPESRRVVVKIGSRVIVRKTGRPDTARIRALVEQVASLRRDGYEVVIVSSGAIAAGMEALAITKRPTAVPDLQMCAAVGQGRLMACYSDFFAKRKLVTGQILLTHADFDSKIRLANMRRTMDHILARGVVPIINENDAVADEEVKADLSFGDNDNLASLVTRQIRADLLIILSTVDGLRSFSENGASRRIPFVESINKKILQLVRAPDAGGLSKGGMDSKLKAASVCMKAGCNVVIADGKRKDVLTRAVAGGDEGTLFMGSPE